LGPTKKTEHPNGGCGRCGEVAGRNGEWREESLQMGEAMREEAEVEEEEEERKKKREKDKVGQKVRQGDEIVR
jgi:uncharacterized Zn ribbon protein